MFSLSEILFSIPFVDGIYQYFASFQTHVDFEGQQKAERIYQVVLTLFGIVGFIWGFAIQQLSATVYCVLCGFALSCLIILPPWPFLRRNPLQWQKSIGDRSYTKKVTDSKKKK